jgi:hypothetical protein
LIYQEDAATIEDIWVEYHKANPENRLCAVIKSETYDLLHARGKMFPHVSQHQKGMRYRVMIVLVFLCGERDGGLTNDFFLFYFK